MVLLAGILVAYVAFGDSNIKSRAERFLSSITNSIEIVLRCNVEVRIILLPDGDVLNSLDSVDLPLMKQTRKIVGTDKDKQIVYTNDIDGFSDLVTCQEPRKVTRGCSNNLEGTLKDAGEGTFKPAAQSPNLLTAGNDESSDTQESGEKIPMQRIESIIREQRLETAWLQTAEKGTPGSLNRTKPEKNQVLPQEGIYRRSRMGSTSSSGLSSQHREDELNNEPKVLGSDEGRLLHKDETVKKSGHHAMSPSLLHDLSFADHYNKDNL